ncbi:MAG: hypothetical protein M0R46_08100 [Candidatus Muirbacterium halophilum]|nr:hypothetical protein [Candidatus Muirbacterium halophilum]
MKIKTVFLFLTLYIFLNANSYEAEKYQAKIEKKYTIPWFEYENGVFRIGMFQHFSDKAYLFSRDIKYLYNENSENLDIFFKSQNKGFIDTELSVESKHTEEKYLGLYFYPSIKNIKKTFSFKSYKKKLDISLFYSNLDYNSYFPMLEGDIFGIELKNFVYSTKFLKDYNRVIGNYDFLLTGVEFNSGKTDFTKGLIRGSYNIIENQKFTFIINTGYCKIYNLEKNWVNSLLKNGSSGLHIRGLKTEIYAKEMNFRSLELISPLYSNFNIKFSKFFSLTVYNRIFIDKGKFILDNFEKSYTTYGDEIILRTILMGKIPLNIVLSFYKDENKKSSHYSYFLIDL